MNDVLLAILAGSSFIIANNKIEEQNETIARFTDKMLDLL